MNASSSNDAFSFGFTTAAGSSINVSGKALSKAVKRFINELTDTDNHEETSEYQKQSNERDAQLPNVGFQTANGQRVNIPNEALLKAKALFSDETIENTKCTISSLNFQTARGGSINVSNKALSKAKKLFIDELKDAESYGETSKYQKQSNECDVQLPNVGFQTASGRCINISNEALLKAETLFSNETAEDTKHTISSLNFQTARGGSINVSNKALSKAKKLFIDELKDTESYGKTSKYQKQSNECDVQLPNVGFQTANGRCINISNEALLKAETLFSNETAEDTKHTTSLLNFQTARGNSITVSNVALLKAKEQFENDIKEETNECNIPVINDGFQTASGKYLTVTKQALQKAETLLSEDDVENTRIITSSAFKVNSKSSNNVFKYNSANAKQLLKNDLENVDDFKEMCIIEKQANKYENQTSNIEFETASGRCMNVTKDALLKAEALFCEETSEGFESNSMLNKSLQKRKIKDLDDDVLSNKQLQSNQFKKLRFSNEYKGHTTIYSNSTNNERKKNQEVTLGSSKVSVLNSNADELVDNIQINETSKKIIEVDNSLISHEIVASTVALLADEKDSDSSEQWISPTESKENKEISNIPSSPVIGGKFIAKKRRSINNRKRSTKILKSKENKFVSVSDLKQLNDNCVNLNLCINEESKCLIQKESSNEEKKFDTSVVNEFGDTQLMIDFINQSASILEKRLEAALEQDKQISLKKRYKPKPTIGKLYFHRKTNHNNRVSWREISKGNKPVPCTHKELIERKLPLEILDITANNAGMFKFRCVDFYGQEFVQNNIEGISLEDGACLILDENGYAGITEIKRSFLASPGVDPNLLPGGWVENHYRWIIWKLASVDRIKLGSVILPRILTPVRVMMELKYRYDREIDRSQRSALRKILEKDDVASRRMILCVTSITECDDSSTASSSNPLKISSKKLILTDGWYSIEASIDQAMIKNIISGKVKEGTKLATYGSELLNCDQGCSPLEVPTNVCLKIHTNSTRRVKWDTKLGYIAPSGPICIKLGTICSNGGLIGKIKVTIARVYPILYYEKTATGESIFRNARCEEKAIIAHEKKCRLTIEAFYAKAEKYFSASTKKSHSDTDSIDLAAIEWNEDCEKLSKEEFLSTQELEQLKNNCRMKEEQFRQKLESRLQESLPAPRQVTPVLKIRVIEEETNAILSIWSPNEEVTNILKEGNCVSISNIMPLGRRGNELQLTASRNAIFNQRNIFNTIYPRRIYTALCDINKTTFAPAYGELDTVGIVVCIGSEPYGMKNFEAVHLAYPHTDSQSSYMSILFWYGIVSQGYAEILTVGSFVACNNLEWRRATSWNIPITYCTERSTFTRNPRQNHLQQPFEDLKRLIKDVSTYVATCAAEISEEVQKKPTTRMSDNFCKTSYNENYNSDKQFGAYETKSIAIQKRLEKLQHYGEPSSLSPIVLNNSSKRVSLEFQSPVRSTIEKQAKPHTLLNKNFERNSR